MLMPRSVFEEAGGFDVEPRAAGAQGCEDLLFLMRVAEHVPFRSVPRYLVGYRMTEGNMSSDTRQMRRAFEVTLAKNQQRSPQFAAEHAKHMAQMLRWPGCCTGDRFGPLARLRLISFDWARSLRSLRSSPPAEIYWFGRDSLLRRTSAEATVDHTIPKHGLVVAGQRRERAGRERLQDQRLLDDQAHPSQVLQPRSVVRRDRNFQSGVDLAPGW